MEPTDTPQTKPRKRRRWLILAVLLFVGSTTTWWYWPRGDARFVGKWAVSGGPTILELKPNGVGHIYNGSTIDYYFFWRANGAKLLFKPTIPEWLASVAPRQLCGAPGGCQSWQVNTIYTAKPHVVRKYRNDPHRLYLGGGYLGVFTDLWLTRIPE